MVPRRHFLGAIGYPVASFALVDSMVLDPRRMARARGLLVIADGAHALARFDFALADLDCDYYASSLHKRLFAPHGTGMQ